MLTPHCGLAATARASELRNSGRNLRNWCPGDPLTLSSRVLPGKVPEPVWNYRQQLPIPEDSPFAGF